MTICGNYWPDLFCVAVTLVLVNGALTGKFYSHGRGGPPKLVAFVRSFRARISFLLVAAALTSWVVIDFGHKVCIH